MQSALRNEAPRLYTSNFVLDETLTLLARRTDHAFALREARAWYASDILTILRPDENDESEALLDFERFADQRVSFTDCVSFVLMRRFGLVRAFERVEPDGITGTIAFAFPLDKLADAGHCDQILLGFLRNPMRDECLHQPDEEMCLAYADRSQQEDALGLAACKLLTGLVRRGIESAWPPGPEGWMFLGSLE